MKNCTNTSCSQKNPQELSAFSCDKRSKSGLQSRCKACDKEYHLRHYSKRTSRNAEWAKKNPERNKANQKAYDELHPLRKRVIHIKNRFGMSLVDYEIKLNSQNNCCAICLRPASEFKKRLHIDHCHETGKVRGLLCKGCNFALGIFKDSSSTLRKAAEYLEFYL